MDVLSTIQILKFGGALLLVLALMLGLSAIMRRVNAGQGIGLQGQKRRLKIVEVLPIGARHRAVLIKRDDVEHLVILSPTGETVVESGITPPAGTQATE
jgi:flagellar protein FliO/FliZ